MFASEEIESLLKAELDEAESQLRNAKPHEKDQARLRFREALHTGANTYDFIARVAQHNVSHGQNAQSVINH